MQNITPSNSPQSQLQKPWFVNMLHKKKELCGEKNMKYDAYYILS